MNNLDYICERHKWVLGSLLDSLSCDDWEAEVRKTLDSIGIPESAMAGGESMSEWLSEERTPGAWQPDDSPAAIIRDVDSCGKTGFPAYLINRGIGFDGDCSVVDAAVAVIKDVNLRWMRQYLQLSNSKQP